MVIRGGVEPTDSAVKGRRLNHLTNGPNPLLKDSLAVAVIDHEHSDIEYTNTAIHTFVSQYLSETGGFLSLDKVPAI